MTWQTAAARQCTLRIVGIDSGHAIILCTVCLEQERERNRRRDGLTGGRAGRVEENEEGSKGDQEREGPGEGDRERERLQGGSRKEGPGEVELKRN